MMHPLKRVIAFRTDRLGETILTLPLLQAIKSHPTCTHLTLVANPALVSWLKTLPWLSEVIAAPFSASEPWWKQAASMCSELNARRFDTAVIVNPLKSLHVAVWLKRIPNRIGYKRKCSFFLTNVTADNKVGSGLHELELNLQLLKLLNITPPSDIRWNLPLASEASKQAFRSRHQLPENKRLIAIHPWSSNPEKQWPLERYHQLALHLKEASYGEPILIGGEDESLAASQAGIDRWPTRNLIGKLSLVELALCLQSCDLLVSNDSGPVHMAAAYQRPVIALFGTSKPGTLPNRWKPWGDNHTVLWEESMGQISLPAVVDAVKNRLSID